MPIKHFVAGLGFAFVAAWIAFGFGDAILCLVGAGLFYGIAAVVEGSLDLGDVQDRLRQTATPGSPAPAPRSRAPRVQ